MWCKFCNKLTTILTRSLVRGTRGGEHGGAGVDSSNAVAVILSHCPKCGKVYAE